MSRTFRPPRVSDTVPPPVLVVGRSGGQRRGVVILADAAPGPLARLVTGRVARLVGGDGSFPIVGRDHRADLATIDRATASWPAGRRFDTLRRAGHDPRWARWTADGMRERHEDPGR